ncbi:MAG: hypothetical protein ACFFD4_38120 [Candidatus Odinarchaeota archaeon]
MNSLDRRNLSSKLYKSLQELQETVFQKLHEKNYQFIIISLFFVLGLVLRLYSTLTTVVVVPDANGYIALAKTFKELRFSEYQIPREPGFPLMLTLVFLFFPNDFTTSRITTAITGAFVIPLTYIAANSLQDRLKKENQSTSIMISYIATLLVTINPYTVLTDGRGLREPLTGVLILLLLTFYFRLQTEPTSKNMILVTVLSTVAISVKFEMLFITMALAILFLFYRFSHYGLSRANWKEWLKYTAIPVIIFSFYLLLDMTTTILLDGLSISNDHASRYYEREFGTYKSLTVLEYVFEYHSITQIISYIYHGIAESFTLYYYIFNLFGFALVVLGFFYLVDKNHFEIPVLITLSILPQAFFIHAWGWKADIWRLFLPYVPIACICIGFILIKVISDIKIQIYPNKYVIVSRLILIAIALLYFTVVYLIGSFSMIATFQP